MFVIKLGRVMAPTAASFANATKLKGAARSLPKLVERYSTFKHEMSLPHLPVPPLQQTMEKYLLSMKPLLTENEFECTKAVVADFRKPGGVGEQLQEKLVSRSYKMENWLSEWWDDVAYFGYQNPVVVHSSPGIAFPKQNFSSKIDQLRFSAKAIRAVLGLKSLIDSESLSVDMQGKDPVTMVQYSRLLSSCRIAHPTKDFAVATPAHLSRHIIVMCNGQAFEMDVYKGAEPLEESELLSGLSKIVRLAENSEELPPVGVLTTTDRRIWGRTYNKLKRDSVNNASLDKIIKSVFVLCLDKSNGPASKDLAACEDADMSITVSQVLHGGGSAKNSCNRWFDKVFQMIVSEDGHVGCCYEHSSAEGPPVQLLCNHILNRCELDGNPVAEKNYAKDPVMLQWRLSDELEDKVDVAKETIDQLVDDLDLRMIRYKGCGKNVAKANRVSPDAFVQLGLQLAYYRLHGHLAPTYESASIRKFRLGRTETIRSASLAVKAFCDSMVSSDKNDSERRVLLMKAMNDHTKYTKEAANGQGIDRHMLGLKLICMESNIKLPEIFRDKGYNYGLHFKLSTSQVPSPFDTVLCFGPVVPDGYGVCYNPMEEHLNFAVSAFNSNPETSTARFAESLKCSFDDLQKVLAKAKL